MFNFLSPQEVLGGAKWQEECNNNPGGAAGRITAAMLVGKMEAELNFERARIWARKHTSTGLMIIDAVRKSKVKINVVAWRSSNPAQPGFSMFSNDSPLWGEGTIYVNLEQLVEVATPNPEDAKKSRILNNFVLIVHEIGHAKQFIDTPSWFRNNEGTGNYIANVRDNGIKPVLAAKTGKTWGIDAKVDRILGQPAKKFSSAIEWENYIYHEGPVCDQIGVARRISYGNLNAMYGNTNIAGSMF